MRTNDNHGDFPPGIHGGRDGAAQMDGYYQPAGFRGRIKGKWGASHLLANKLRDVALHSHEQSSSDAIRTTKDWRNDRMARGETLWRAQNVERNSSALCSRREKKKGQEKKMAKSSLAVRSQGRIPVACHELRKLQLSNLLNAPLTTWPLVVLSSLLELLGWKSLPDTCI